MIDSGQFLQLFTKWILNKVKSEKSDKFLFFSLLLGGSHKESYAMWRRVLALSLGWLVLKGAANRIFFGANHAIKIRNYGNVDIFVSTLHHFCNLKYFDLEHLWFVSGRGNSRTFFPIHDLASHLDSDLVENLPAIHALTRCDTASKVGTKIRAFREGTDCYQLLYAFGRDASRDKIIADNEKFLL